MPKQLILFGWMCIAGLLVSCKEEIELDIPDGEPKVVIEAEVNTETDSSYVRVSRTVSYYSGDQVPDITNATVQINGVVFSHTGKGLYKPASPYTGVAGQTYNLSVSVEGVTYSASSTLEKMFRIDSVFQTFKPKSGFIDEGWAVNYIGFDNRPKVKYTYFRLGYFDTLVQRDSIQPMKILFNSEQTPVGVPYPFELPFTRFKKGDECLMIFRSCDKFMFDFIMAYSDQTSGAPGPFQPPPANLPTNISNGAIGYFATYDIVRKRYTIK